MALMAVFCVQAQNAVSWTIKLVGDKTENPSIQMTASIKPGYHMYAVDNPAGGSNPLQFFFDTKGVKLDGKPVANKKYTVEFDDVFEINQHFYSGSVTFTQKLKPTAKDYKVDVEIKGQACNDGGCVPLFASKSFKGTSPVATAEADASEEMTDAELADDAMNPADSATVAAGAAADNAELDKGWWANVEDELNAAGSTEQETQRSLWYILIAGFIGGLIALVGGGLEPLLVRQLCF